MTEKKEINYPNLGQSWGIIGIAILLMIAFFPFIIVLDNFLGKELTFLIYYLLSMGVTFLIANQIKRKRTGDSVYTFDFSTTKIIVLVSVGAIAIQMGLIYPVVNLIPIPDFIKNIFLELANQKGVFTFLSIVIAAPILEELIFRGIILDGLLRKYAPVKSILISSLLFGFLHLNPWQFITALMVGVF